MISNLINTITDKLDLYKIKTKEFKEERLKLGHQIIQSIKTPSKIHWKHFAQMSNHSTIRNTSYVGGVTGDSINEWLRFFEKMPSKETAFFPSKLNTNAVKYVVDNLKSSLESLKLIEDLGNLQREEAASRLHKYVVNEIEAKKQFILPFDYSGSAFGNGHVMPLFFSLSNSTLKIYVLNEGAGSECHPLLDIKSTEKRYSFMSHPYVVNWKQFQGLTGKAFLGKLLSYTHDRPDPTLKGYLGSMIYDDLSVIGKLTPETYQHPDLYAEPGQLVGNCAEKGAKNLCKMSLILSNCPIEEINLVILNKKIFSLISAFNIYKNQKDRCNEHLELIRDATFECGILIKSMEKFLDKNKSDDAFSVLYYIKLHTKPTAPFKFKRDNYSEDLKPEHLTFTISQKTFRNFNSLFELYNKDKNTDSTVEKKGNRNVMPEFGFCVESFPSDLKDWSQWIKQLDTKYAYAFFYQVVSSLPCPKVLNDDTWDYIPEEKIPEIIDCFVELACYGIDPKDQTKSLVCTGKLLAIANKLGMRCNSLKMGSHFCLPYLPLLLPLKNFDTFEALVDPSDNIQHHQVDQYFTKLYKKFPKIKKIFPTEEIIPVSKVIDEDKIDNYLDWQILYHTAYIEQFKPRDMVASRIATAMNLWGNKEVLPKAVFSLYTLVQLHNLNYSYDRRSQAYPDSVEFTTTGNGKSLQTIFSKHQVKLFKDQLYNNSETDQYRIFAFDTNFEDHSSLGYELFKKSDIRSMKLNDAVTKILSEDTGRKLKINEETYRGLLRITRTSNQKALNAFQWIKFNPLTLSNTTVKSALFHCIFQPGALYNAIKNEPSIAAHFRSIISEALTLFSKSGTQNKSRLFLVRCGIFLEGICIKLKNSEVSEDAFKRYLNVLRDIYTQPIEDDEMLFESCIRCAVNLYMAADQLPNFHPKEAIAFIIASFPYQNVDSSHFHYLLKHQKIFDNQKDRNDILNKAASLFFLSKGTSNGLEENWEGAFPVFSNKGTTIHLLEGTVESSALKMPLLDYIVNDSIGKNDYLQERKNELKKGLYLNDYFANTPDSKIQVVQSSEQIDIIEKIDYNGKWIQSKYLDTVSIVKELLISKTSIPFITFPDNIPFVLLSPIDKTELSCDFFAINTSTKKPFLEGTFDKETAVLKLYKLTSTNKRALVVNLDAIQDNNHKLYKAAKRFAHSQSVICCIDEDSKQLEEIHFTDMNLTFTKKSKGLECEEHPGYILNYETKCQLLGDYNCAMVLEKEIPTHSQVNLTQKKIILHNYELELGSDDFSKEIKIKPPESGSSKSTYIFEFDPHSNRLKSSSVQANLYVAYILKLQNKYDLALSYLPKTTVDSGIEKSKLIDYFFEIKDSTPMSIAFNMHLISMLVSHANLLTEELISKHNVSLKKIYQYAIEEYTRYLRTFTESGLSPIPFSLRLSFYQEESLLRALHRNDRNLPDWLLTRLHASITTTSKKTTKIEPTLVSTHPKLFRNLLDEPLNFNWIHYVDTFNTANSNDRSSTEKDLNYITECTPDMLLERFPELFEKAKSVVREEVFHPFDLILLPLLRTQPDASHDLYNVPLQKLLVYVSFFPDLFSHIRFDKNDSSKEIKSKLREISEILEKVYEHNNMGKFETYCSEAQAKFPYKKTGITISVSPPRNQTESLQLYNHSQTTKQLQDVSIDRLTEEISNLKKEIKLTLNDPWRDKNLYLSKEMRAIELYRMEQSVLKSRKKLTHEDIMFHAIIKNDPGYITSQCPFISSKELENVITNTKELYHLLTLELLHIKIENAKSEGLSEKEIRELQEHTFNYSPYKHPVLSYFSVCSNTILRKGQVETYLWFADQVQKKTKNMLFEGYPGMGKSSVITPLFCLSVLSQKERFPVVFVPLSMYSVEKHDLAKRLGLASEAVVYLELGLHMKPSFDELKHIEVQLLRASQEKKTVLMVPQTYHTLYLMWKNAFKENDTNKIEKLSFILKLFHTKAFLIGDESHLIKDPLTMAIFGSGEFHSINPIEQQVIYKLTQQFLKIKSQYNDNLQELQEAVGEFALKKYYSKYGDPVKKELLNYWVSPSEEYIAYPSIYDEWKEDTDKLRAPMVLHFIQDILPTLCTMRPDLDHGRSPYPEKEYDTPLRSKKKSPTEFENRYLATALTVKGYQFRGLNRWQVEKLLGHLLENAEAESSVLITNRDSSEKVFQAIVKGSEKFKHLSLYDIDFSKEDFKHLAKHVGSNKKAINLYLKEFVLKTIGSPESLLTSTPAEMLRGFQNAVLFSGTPGNRLTYGLNISAVKENPESNELILETCHKDCNQEVLTVDSFEPNRFFRSMKEFHSESYKKMEAIVDVGGKFCRYSNRKVAKSWLKNSDLDGVIYVKESFDPALDAKEKIQVIMKNKKEFELNGNDIKTSFLENGCLPWSELKIGMFYDASHTQSLDMILKKNIKFGVTVGKTTDFDQTLQGVNRPRGFIKPDMQQHAVWLIPKKLESRIFSNEKRDFSAIEKWTKMNRKTKDESRIISAAFQEIESIFSHLALETILNQKDVIKKQESYNKHKSILNGSIQQDAFKKYGYRDRKLSTDDVLWNFAKCCLKKFDPQADENIKNFSGYQELKTIIEDVHEAINTIPSKGEDLAVKEVQVQVSHKTKQKQTFETNRYVEKISAVEEIGNLKITHPNYFDVSNVEDLQTLFNTQSLTSNLYLEINQYSTAKEHEQSLGVKFLKPIETVMILTFNDPERYPVAMVLSNTFYDGITKSLIKGSDNPDINHQAFLIKPLANDEWVVCLKGAGRLKPDDEKIKEILGSDWAKSLLDDVLLLQGKISNLGRITERAKKDPNFVPLLKKIAESQPNPNPVFLKSIQNLQKEVEKHEN